jgi:formylglycine-generating enzyme required for sulfatase activity
MTFFFKLLRGGSWLNNPRDCRSAFRNHNGPAYADNYVGFRMVCHSSVES